MNPWQQWRTHPALAHPFVRLIMLYETVLCPCPQAVTRRLTHLVHDVLAAKQRSKALTAESPGMATPGNTGGVGSVEHTLKVGLGPFSNPGLFAVCFGALTTTATQPQAIQQPRQQHNHRLY